MRGFFDCIFIVALQYDFGEKRVAKALKIARKYLHWVQNSVFEGEISVANYEKLKRELLKNMNEKEDSVIFYTFRTTKYSKRESLGLKKGGDDNIL
jgi:CRISPR-associated protein Cas2